MVRRRRIKDFLGISEASLPITYMGTPLFCGKPRRSHFSEITTKIKRDLSSWKGKTLSMAGRIALVNSVSISKLVYTFSLYSWPLSLLKSINRMFRNFIWVGDMYPGVQVILVLFSPLFDYGYLCYFSNFIYWTTLVDFFEGYSFVLECSR